MSNVIPVILFAYARPVHTARVLACLRENGVPLLHVFADAAKGAADAAAAAETRALIRAIDWCEVQLTERGENIGLGRNILGGVTAIAAAHEAFIVWEDDLICVPGTYSWMCGALRRYAGDPGVMSVTGWTHPRLTPTDAGTNPYFDGRAEGWVWGGYARSWRGMEEPALRKLAAATRRGVAPDAYGSDLPEMAKVEETRNIWAVRWCYHHLAQAGLCVRPPWSMIEHIGFDATATNAAADAAWANPPLRAAPPVPGSWPEPRENPQCARLWRRACPGFWGRKFAALAGRLGFRRPA